MSVLNAAVYIRLGIARNHLLQAAKAADEDGDTRAHRSILLALTALDDAMAPDEPLSAEVIAMWKETT